MTILSRRRFLQIGAGAAGAGCGSLFARDVPTYCDLCFWKCGAIATVKNGRLWKIEGNPADPLSRGRLCPRGTGGVGAHYDTDRLRAPCCARRTRRGRVEGGDLGRGPRLHRREAAEDRRRARPEAMALLQPRHRRQLPQAHLQGVRHAEHRRAVLRPVPRPARRRLPADLRRGGRTPRAHRHRQRRCLVLIGSHLGENMHNTQVQEFAEASARRHGHRRRSALLGRRGQGQALPADQARHRHRAAAGLDERARHRETLRPRVRRAARLRLRGFAAPRSPYTPEWAYPKPGSSPR
jgi:thiosulfate reductase/polysulfide reductase chain A